MKDNNEKGITLIALVITVILMLILAGVAISALTGDGGLFDKTRGAAEMFENASQKEAKQLEELMSEIDGYLNEFLVDKSSPSVAKLAVSNITDTGFTLTATGKDNVGVVKYEFYIKNDDGTFVLEKTIEMVANSVTYTVSGKEPLQNSYEYKVKVYDEAGNSKESNVIEVGAKKASALVNVGDYINYDAGVWTEEDLTKITSSAGNPTLQSTVNDDVTGNQSLPTVQGQFGGFELGQSRNTNSTEYQTNRAPSTAGWRVWSVDTNTDVVTLISAGHSESYYHQTGNSVSSENILKNRDCTMYVNEYATSANILSGAEAVTWYNARFNTNYTFGTKGSNFFGVIYTTAAPIDVLENGAYSWLASQYDTNWMFCLHPGSRNFSNGIRSGGMGIRVLITLKADVFLELNTGDGNVNTPWKIVQK